MTNDWKRPIADVDDYGNHIRMKTAERILYASAGAHFSAAFVGQAFEWKSIYYGSFAIGAVAAIWLVVAWLRNRQMSTEGS